jgi:cobalt-precorrin-6B (C15)-methyltransferase
MKDSEFIRAKVPMTKEEVRLLTIERLQLQNAKRFIDVGAGTGSIAIEAALRHPSLSVLAIERNPQAVELIRLNRAKFAADNVDILEAYAPVELSGGQADAMFIGGSGGNLTEIIDWSEQLLLDGGRLALNFILLDNLMEAMTALRQRRFADIDVCQLQVSHLTGLGSGEYFKPNNPTYIISCRKAKESVNAECN